MTETNKSALILLFDGFEEIEAVTPIDLLRRAGIEVTTASLNDASKTLKGRDNILIEADQSFTEASSGKYDCIIVPGGPGFASVKENEAVLKLLKEHAESGALIAAICAAPAVLEAAGLLKGKNYTAHFSMKDSMNDIADDIVVTDGNILTSQGAGTAIEFSLKIISKLIDTTTADEVARSICYHA